VIARGTLLRAGALLLGGACYVLALPPFDAAGLAWVAVVPLLLVIADCSPGQAFAWGLFYGFTTAWAATWFFAVALAHYFATGILLAVVGMSIAYTVAIASTFALFAAATALVAGMPRRRTVRALLVAAIWAASELVRVRLFAQPWGLLGYTQHAHVGLIQVAAATGVYGVSFLLVLANAALAEAVRAIRRGDRVRHAIAACGLPAALIMFVWLYGTARAVHGPAGGFAAHPVAIVQSGVAPAYRWTRGYAEQQLLAHMRATDALAPALHPGLVVWPENALTLYLENEPALAKQLGALASRRQADILFGAPRFEAGHTYNSARLVTATGRPGGHYDKQRLVLFAEAPPLGAGPAAASESPRSFTAGTGPGVLQSFVPIGVSICHEILYPDVINRSVRAGAALLVNISNDGWLDAGYGFASRQHFAMATFRAVETRRYLVRAATTGVSGVIDPFGRVLQALPPNTVGTATATVAGRTGLTLYVRLGDAFAFGCTFIVLLLAASRVRRARPVLSWPRRPERAPVPAH
jgi:apolipoprotein N-acyltransferase